MTSSRRPERWELIAAVLLMLLVVGAACTPEDYGPCTLPSSEALNDACSPEGGDEITTSAASCVVDFVFECESQLCGTFQGSDPFCTERCSEEDPTCPQNGVCLEWVPGLGEFYCVPTDLVPGAEATE